MRYLSFSLQVGSPMQKNKVCFEVEIDGKKMSMYIDDNATLGQVFDALTQMRNHVVELIKKVTAEKEQDDSELHV